MRAKHDHFVATRWRPIPSCPGYVASDYGRIRNAATSRMLLGRADRDGYRLVNIAVAGKRVTRKVHRLVCEAWHGPCPDGLQCGHLDGTRDNNRAENLAWITRSENNRHQYLHGSAKGSANLIPGQYFGAANPMASLTAEQAAAVRERGRSGESCRKLAAEFSVGKDVVNRIVRGDSYPEGIAQ